MEGTLGESAGTLADCLEFDKTLDMKIERTYHYASLQLAEDGANPITSRAWDSCRTS